MGTPLDSIGLMGGTFNPIHLGHLRAAEDIAEQLGLRRLVFIPAGTPPHKPATPVAPFEHRLNMVRLAVEDHAGFEVSDVEGHRQGLSYTVETLRHFRDRFGPELNLYFITGLDAFLEVSHWRDYPRLFDLASFVVVNRDGRDPSILGQLLRSAVSPEFAWDPERKAFIRPDGPPVLVRNVLRLDISSTDIRRRLAEGRSVRYLVPEAVRLYIRNNGLYLTAPGGAERNIE